MRGGPEMTSRKSMKSLIVPWHNEWLAIWFYISFTIYFWFELIDIMSHDRKNYDFINHKDYEYMFIATLGIAISLTMTTTYLIFYSQSQKLHDQLERADYMGKIVMVFSFTFAFIGSAYATSSLEFMFMFLVTVVMAVNLVLL